MTSMGLILKGLRFKPVRSVLLLFGFAVGVMVMTVLLSVGSAILDQARDTDLVGGGDIVVLPAGIDVSVMKTGGVTGMFFRIPNGRFLTRSFITPERSPGVITVSPEISGVSGRLIGDELEYPLTITGVIPSRFRDVHPTRGISMPDGPADVAYARPGDNVLFDEIDRFHAIQRRPDNTWAEWHYFNFHNPETGEYGYLSLSASADPAEAENNLYSRGIALLELHLAGREPMKLTNQVPSDAIVPSLSSPNLVLGDNEVRFEGGAYRVRARLVDDRGRPVRIRFTLHPDTPRHLPPLVAPDEARTIGYAVPVVRGQFVGSVQFADSTCELRGIGYHDHNWGFFREAIWDWGIVRAGELDILYGRLSEHTEALEVEPVFVAVFDERGPVALKTGGTCTTQWQEGAARPEPTAVRIDLVDGSDSLSVRIEVAGLYASTFGSSESPPGTTERLFYQMEGGATVSGSLLGEPVRAYGRGFAETFSTPTLTDRSR